MSNLLFIVPLMVLSAASFSQPATTPARTVKTDYLHKSIKQKNTAIILLCSGSVLSASAIFIGPREKKVPGVLGMHYDFTGNNIILITGLAAMGVSIPLFIAAKKNSHKALSPSAYLKMEKMSGVQPGTWVETLYPAISVKISL